MITTNDIADILCLDCKAFGIAEIYRLGYVKEVPKGGLRDERIVVIPKKQSTNTRWLKDFVEVNLCVPDLGEGIADIDRLQELERMAKLILDHRTGMFDGTRYHYKVFDLDGMVEDKDIKCHYVNVRLLFNVLNVN